MRAPSLAAMVAVLLALPACGLFRKSTEGSAASGSASGSTETTTLPIPVQPLDGLGWKPLQDPSFIGLPQGCTLRTARQVTLPRGVVRFTAPAEGSELIMAIDTDGNDTVDRAGVLDRDGRPGGTFPWTALGAPPSMMRSPAGFIAARATETAGGVRSAALWSPSGQVRSLVEGDHIEVADASCRGSTCAVLTSFAAKSAGPGATLLYGDPAAAVSTWKRIDLPGGDEDWAPFSIVDIEAQTVLVALTGREKVGMWRVTDGKAVPAGTMAAPFGVYDVVLGDLPVAVIPGESIDAECAKDGFVVKLVGSNGKALDLDAQVPPESVVVRRLEGGFIVGWLSPTRCRIRSRQMARAFLLGHDGTPRSSTMAVTEADGFALSTHGADLDLWLARQGDLVWAKGACRIPDSAPPAK